jgi:2-polyprenyl-6-methoxyphenol hydroxylase-like FAD-dependent oxidoreductase
MAPAVPNRVTCLIAGGGPAGVMLGYLLAREGVEVWVLEKHLDFFRDFRGDTVHPSTLEVMNDLGLLEAFLRLPHSEIRSIRGQIGPDAVTLGDFTRLPVRCPFIAIMPQWDFLNFLVEAGRALPSFHVQMGAEVVDLVEQDGAIAGVRVQIDGAIRDVRAALTIGADGRQSIVRARAGLRVRSLGAPMDVLWLRLPKEPSDGSQPLGRVDAGRFLVMIDRTDYWQCAFLIPKGTVEALRARGLPTLRAEIASVAPFLRARLEALTDWSDVKPLTVMVDRLETWHRPGLLCIGDAAHAMSPIGGIGINLAIQDAVATANLLAPSLLAGRVTDADLARVERRRLWPTRVTQRVQLTIQNVAIAPVLNNRAAIVRAPWPLRIVSRTPFLQRLAARFIGVGVRPERVRQARPAQRAI